MPIIITAVLCLWLLIAWRQYERGDLLLAGVCALVGILLALYRWKVWQARQNAKTNDKV
jgi:hypothetical protein